MAALEKADKTPAPAPAAAAAPAMQVAGESDQAAKKPLARTANTSSAASTASKAAKGAAEEPATDMNLINDGKRSQREKDDKSLKTLKWNFVAPRPEYLTQLQEQSRGCFGKGLLVLMFAEDFRGHVKVLDALSELAKQTDPAVLPNADLILKWITIRFFDTNTAVLLRTLQYLQVCMLRVCLCARAPLSIFQSACAYIYIYIYIYACSLLPVTPWLTHRIYGSWLAVPALS
jgi:cytoskeleton-associated protein 5